MAGRKGTSVTLVNGSVIRATRLDSCGRVQYGDNMVGVSASFTSVSAKVASNTTAAINVKNAAGATLLTVPATSQFANYTLEIAFSQVDPQLFSLITGQAVTYDAFGQVDGFAIDSQVDLTPAMALEVWAGAPTGAACVPGATGSFGYVVFPYLVGGVLGDHDINAGAIDFSMTGLASLDGNSWGVGPYNVMANAAGTAGPLNAPLTATSHELFKVVTVAPPSPTVGLRPQLDPTKAAVTGITGSAGTGTHNEVVTFTGATSGSLVQVDFGDGTWDYVTGTSTNHTYAAAGNYTVRATTNNTWVSAVLAVA